MTSAVTRKLRGLMDANHFWLVTAAGSCPAPPPDLIVTWRVLRFFGVARLGCCQNSGAICVLDVLFCDLGVISGGREDACNPSSGGGAKFPTELRGRETRERAPKLVWFHFVLILFHCSRLGVAGSLYVS